MVSVSKVGTDKESINKSLSALGAIIGISQALSASLVIVQKPLSEEDNKKLDVFMQWLKETDDKYKELW